MSSGSLEGYVNVTKERRDGLVYTFAPVFEHCIEWNITNSCSSLYTIFTLLNRISNRIPVRILISHTNLSQSAQDGQTSRELTMDKDRVETLPKTTYHSPHS